MDTIIAVAQPDWAHERLIWRICLTLTHVLGILASIYRISRRYKTRQSGLDDYAATLALILDLFFFPTLWLATGDASREVSTAGLSAAAASGALVGDDLPADLETRIAQVVVDWVVQIGPPLLTWTTKASLALTIARLIPPSHGTHKASLATACLSALLGLGILIQIFVFCAKVDKTWSHTPPYTCRVTELAGIFRSTAEIAIDIVLVIIPFVTFFFRFPLRLTFKRPSPTNNNDPIGVRVHLLPVTRRLLQICFLASLLTTAVVILTLTLLFKTHTETRGKTGYMALVLVHLNGSVSLLVCNLLIVITSLYRFLRTPTRIIEIGKTPVIPNLPNQENDGLEPSGAPSNDDNSDTSTRERGRVTAESNVSENSGSSFLMNSSGGGTGSSNTGIELTEVLESDFSMA